MASGCQGSFVKCFLGVPQAVGLYTAAAKLHREARLTLTIYCPTLYCPLRKVTNGWIEMTRRNAPKFGIAHAMALGLGPWLAVEIPEMIQKGVVTYKEKGS